MSSPLTKQADDCVVLSEMGLQSRHAAEYGNGLLADLCSNLDLTELADHPALAWKRSGLLRTTKLMLPLPLASHVDGALMALKKLLPHAALPKNGALLMGERARLRGTIRKGRHCAGGNGRLLDTSNGRIALNLVREDDWDLIPAWLEEHAEDWVGIAEIIRHRDTKALVERGADMGLAVAEDALPSRPSNWVSIKHFEKSQPTTKPLIIDLSGLWAGPLASSLLSMGGAQIIKIESPIRPDGMRFGHKGFYDLINAGKECVALNFKEASDIEKLKGLLDHADVVIEASRPRALQQLGITGEDFVARNPGQVWSRVTAYGRNENRIGFGDDIGISAGLSSIMEQTYDEPCFVGDAIADPVTGVHLTLAIQAMLSQGGGAVIDISMKDVLRYAMGDIPDDLKTIALEWQAIADKAQTPFYALREPQGKVKDLGADNVAWQC